MSAAIDFAVRSSAGGNTMGTVAGDEQANFVQVGAGDSISLNISKESVLGYQRVEGDLVVELADGRTIILLGYYDVPEGVVNHLYLSSDNNITEVLLSESGDGYLVADYGPVSAFDKWSPLDDLRFVEGDPVVASAGATNEPAGMGIFTPALLGMGGGGLGAAAAGGAVLVGGAALGGGGGSAGTTPDGGGTGGGTGGNGGGGGGTTPSVVLPPSVNGAGSTQVLSTTVANPSLQVTGTGNAGDTVTVTVGSSSQTTTITTGGTWSTTFPTNALPPDGNYQVQAAFTGSTSTTLPGAMVVIDMTPPPLVATEGTGSTNDVENLAEYANGVTLKGTGEAGASVSVTIEQKTHTTSVAQDGTWSVTFSQAEVAGGERTVPVSLTSTDIHGNVTRLTDTLVLDTIPHPLAVDQVSGDGFVNRTEQAQAVSIGGSTTAGAVVSVTIPGVVTNAPVVADAQGRWSYSIAGGTLVDGTYNATVTTVDAAGNPSSASRSFIVDTQTSVSFANMAGHAAFGDGIVNLSESRSALTVTGQAEAGSTRVDVAWQGTTYAANVNATTGAWTLTLPAGAAGSVSGMTSMTVTSTDRAGNTASNVLPVRVDLEAGITLQAAPGGADGVVSGAERASGFTLEGTADANARVFVTYMGTERMAVADANGRWTLPMNTIASGEIASGANGGLISLYSIDAANNRSETLTRNFAVDTLVRDFSFANPDLVGAVNDGPLDAQRLNAAERTAGLVINGTVEAGSVVTIQIGQFSATVPAADTASGRWSYTVPAAALPEGVNATATISVRAQDAYGNQTAWEQKTVAIDTVVNNFARSDVAFSVGADGVMNAAEASAGLPVSGKAEAGSTVIVTVDGRSHTVTSDVSGNWSTTFSRNELPSGTRNGVPASIEAIDPNGNRALHNFTFNIDTDAPTAPELVQDSGAGGILSGVFTAYSPDVFSYHEVAASGAAVDVTPAHGAFEIMVPVNQTAVRSELALFSPNLPDGSYLIIRDVDSAGNDASTLYLRTTGETVVDLSRPGLAGFDIAAVDLSSTQGRMNITAAQLQAVTGPDQRLMIHGEGNDRVTMTGATDTQNLHIGSDGQRYAVYTLNGATIFVDEDINRTVI
ncbi:hypothetical protein HYN69_16725 [Gemmobacter aquarius]|uniref:Ig-like domain (Group 3) n=1 Tax=Paragemmobacter aquarius TaxID=2169400 RepID=A0A2S0UQ35_9RHOB|nr:Ig-like domain-containing protein [Gemmobacter aquarius]AWB49926.1 hypothetical protein HYN69_16725 [Gemmobacter aquarius]